MTNRSISAEFAPSSEREAALDEENTRRLRLRVADRAIYASAVATAGTLQAVVAQAGDFALIREHDLAAAWRQARAQQPATGRVVCELPSAPAGPAGRWDAAVLDPDGERAVEVAEMKLARSSKLDEVLWDTVKIAGALASGHHVHQRLLRGLIVAAAPTFEDVGEDLAPVLDTGTWSGGAIVADRPRVWARACGTTRPPLEVPAGIALRRVASLPILAPTPHAPSWELRVLQVTVTDPTTTAIAGA